MKKKQDTRMVDILLFGFIQLPLVSFVMAQDRDRGVTVRSGLVTNLRLDDIVNGLISGLDTFDLDAIAVFAFETPGKSVLSDKDANSVSFAGVHHT